MVDQSSRVPTLALWNSGTLGLFFSYFFTTTGAGGAWWEVAVHDAPRDNVRLASQQVALRLPVPRLRRGLDPVEPQAQQDASGFMARVAEG